MIIDIHIIQPVPFSNMNRDDTNRPKTATYGGSQRLRVSSQSWKRAARELMEEGGVARTYLSRNGNTLLCSKLIDAGMPNELSAAVSVWAFETLGSGNEVVLRFAETELNDLVELLLARQSELAAAMPESADLPTTGKTSKASRKAAKENKFTDVVSKEEIREVFSSSKHRDNAMGLFGRMLASDASVSIDASVQVAHALSTHPIETDFDFFLAMEELPTPAEGQGGAHLGAAEFASGTLYRYATIDTNELLRNCDGDIDKARSLAVSFVESFALSTPGGKKNSTAPSTVPAIVHLAVRSDRSVNMVDAFEKPVVSYNGMVEPSIIRLDERAGLLSAFIAAPNYAGYVSSLATDVANLGQAENSLAQLAKTAVWVALS